MKKNVILENIESVEVSLKEDNTEYQKIKWNGDPRECEENSGHRIEMCPECLPQWKTDYHVKLKIS